MTFPWYHNCTATFKHRLKSHVFLLLFSVSIDLFIAEVVHRPKYTHKQKGTITYSRCGPGTAVLIDYRSRSTSRFGGKNKKLCYRKEDSASVVLSWFSSLSVLFSVTYGLDIPDFSNWCLSRAHRSSIGHISAFWQGRSDKCLPIMHWFSVTSANTAISDT